MSTRQAWNSQVIHTWKIMHFIVVVSRQHFFGGTSDSPNMDSSVAVCDLRKDCWEERQSTCETRHAAFKRLACDAHQNAISKNGFNDWWRRQTSLCKAS